MQCINQGVELLCGQWSYAPLDGLIFNVYCMVNNIVHLKKTVNISKKTNTNEHPQH